MVPSFMTNKRNIYYTVPYKRRRINMKKSKETIAKGVLPLLAFIATGCNEHNDTSTALVGGVKTL